MESRLLAECLDRGSHGRAVADWFPLGRKSNNLFIVWKPGWSQVDRLCCDQGDRECVRDGGNITVYRVQGDSWF